MSAIRSTLVRHARLFSTSPTARNVVTDTAKSTLKKVDRVASDAAVKGIETGEKVADAVKSTVNSPEAEEWKGMAKGTAEELQGKAKGAAEETKGSLQGKKEEYKGAAKGQAKSL